MPAAPAHELEVLHVSHLRFSSDWKLPEHFHADTNEMILVLGGEIETRIGGEVLRGTAGRVLVYPRGVPHEERAAGGPLHLLFAVWRERGPARAPRSRPLISGDGRGRIRQLLEWLLEIPASDQATLSSLLHCALVEFDRGPDPSPGDPVDRVRSHLHRNFAQKITLRDLAKIAHQSPYHFARVFRDRTGLPPMRYLRQMRVEAAKTLIVTSPLPLRAIAAMAGLVDEFHLSRVFRTVTGHPPSRLRVPAKTRRRQAKARRRIKRAG
jgi:AraC-like DNA-binding protein